jgi:GxxExxY protein
MSLIYEDLTEQILAACMEVHSHLGCGLLEAVYAEALEHELRERSIPYIREKEFSVLYKGLLLNKKYKVDFVCFDKIILELKATDKILPVHASQVLNYLKLANLKLGYVVNFGERSLRWERIANLY